MDALLALLAHDPTTEQRLLLLGAFVAVGLLLSLQLSQTASPQPFRWTLLTDETRPYWYTLYVLEAFLAMHNTYPLLLEKMRSLHLGNEEKILNAVWVGLLGLEVLMVLGVFVQGIAKRLGYGAAPARKVKAS
ncbi:uncharacterized protein J7T54_003104 [Emericellopsis cladophorae]|uniref:Uncharacterized protein n=1 Tax=Emericellopsis cladophorae TaxID=2686198 RepID=A0A9Q0BCM3_9HYPO|nr:uncharacterized protein J7T54_003104 [Emericellopsis cladophorae]KAI6780962.1 hypothetical protein J7T54_003104 [Emericellopsis cladophorae]